MNIAIISDFNIAGQPTFLMRAINRYTDHEARCIIAHDDQFHYDKDVLFYDGSKDPEPAFQEAKEIVEWADFFHFGRSPFNWPGVDFNKILNPRNCVVKYYGSELRNNHKALSEWHRKTGIAAITGTDFTITGLLGFPSFYHLGSYFTAFGDMYLKDIPISNLDTDRILVNAGSAGNPIKRYDLLIKTIEELQNEGLPVNLDVSTRLTNDEYLKRKQEGQITFTSLHGGWGISGIESMFLGQVVLCCLDPFILSLYPKNPTIIVDEKTLKDKIRIIIKNREFLKHIGGKSREFAIQNFRTRDIVKRYMYIIDLIANKDNYLKGYSIPETIY